MYVIWCKHVYRAIPQEARLCVEKHTDCLFDLSRSVMRCRWQAKARTTHRNCHVNVQYYYTCLGSQAGQKKKGAESDDTEERK
jgi:hypothetical protein